MDDRLTRRFYQIVVKMLTGQASASGTQRLSLERLDWAGVGAVLSLYEQTEGPEREAIIRAIGQIIEDGKQEPFVVAQVLDLASSLDLAQVQTNVQRLSKSASASHEPVQSALANYLVFRRMRSAARQEVASP
jgi:hypothetical protein